jgi:large conductance mechanosensitive channel
VLKGFKDFVMRGNVVDLAVGVTIGAAFATLVTSFSDSFLKPLINLIGSAEVPGTVDLGENNPVTYGAFFSTLIGFTLTAAVVYFLVVLPMNKLAERRRKGEEPEPKAPSEEVKLLMEIRDALLAGRGGVPPAPRSAQPAEGPEKSR